MLLMTAPGITGAAPSSSASCIECHATYCEAWELNRHGLSLRAFTPELASTLLTPQPADIVIGTLRYRFNSNEQDGWIEERSDKSQLNYKILYALGSKNILIFLTPLERGRLQLLPLAYHIKKKRMV